MILLGIILIIAGWIYQVAWVFLGNDRVRRLFVAASSLGVLLLLFDGYSILAILLACLNLVSMFAAAFVLVRIDA